MSEPLKNNTNGDLLKNRVTTNSTKVGDIGHKLKNMKETVIVKIVLLN